MLMRQLTLIRHGLTVWNKTGQFQGHTDTPLSPEGRRQARALGKYLSKASQTVDLVYSSPLSRSLETAQIVFPDFAIVQDDRLKEIHFGLFEGYTQEDNEKHEAWDWWYADPFKRRAPEGESYEDLRLRAVAWMQDLPALERIVAITHSGTIQMLLSHILGIEHPLWRKRFYLRHSGISRILFKGKEAIIERVNDARHLSSLEADPFLD